jgi:hypothetical protein
VKTVSSRVKSVEVRKPAAKKAPAKKVVEPDSSEYETDDEPPKKAVK